METSTKTVTESAAQLGAPAGWRRMTVAVSELRSGDVVVSGRGREGAPLMVASVDGFGPCCIVEFTDCTATAPVMAGALVEIERVETAAKGGAR